MRQGLFLCLLLTLCLFPLWGAQAEGTYGTRTYVSYEQISLSASSPVADAVDWLAGFIDDEVGGAMEVSTDLMELVELNDENAYALASLDPADRPTAEDITKAYKSFEDASDFNSEIRYYYDRLIYLYNQNKVNREQIMSGELTPADVDRVKLEMAVNDEETASLMTVVVNSQKQWVLTMSNIQTALNGLDSSNAFIAHIRNQAALVLADQAAAIAASEAIAGSEPIVDVISDKEIAVTVVGEDSKTRRSNIRVTLNIKGQAGVSKVTSNNGTAVFWIADFKPNDAGVVAVEVSFDGTAEGYQRRELGVMQFSGGDVLNMSLRKDDGKPYIVKAAFDDADMLTVANGMYLTPKNNLDHTVEIKVETKGKAVNVKGWYRTKFSWETLLSENFAAGDTAARTVTRKWVQKGQAGAFPEQTPIYLTIAEGSGLGFAPTLSDPYEKDLTVFLGEKTKQDEPASGSETSTEVTSKILGGFKFTLPSDWAVIGGTEIKLPLATGFDYEMEIGKSFKLGYNYKVEKREKELWKSENLRQQEQRLKQEKDKNASILKSTANGVKNDYMAHRNESLLGAAKASITPFLYVELSYNFKTNHGVGDIRQGTILAFEYSLTRQFMVGPVPAFIGLELKMKLTVGVTLGLQAEIQNSGMPRDLAFSGATGVNFKVNLEISITVGAGLPRIAYVGLRGCGWINVDITLSAHTTPPVWQLGLRAQAVVKLLFFSKEWTFWQYIYPKPSSGVTPLLAAQWEGSEAAQTLSLAEANTASNFGEPNATASESELIQQLPITGGDVRYVSVQDNLSYAFWIGRSTKNSDQTRLLYYRFDPTSSQSGTMGEVEFGDLQANLQYTYEFDVDVYQGNAYLIVSSGNAPPSALPDDSDAALEQMMAAQKNTRLFAGVWQASQANPTMITKSLCSNIGNSMRYIPRIRALTPQGSDPYYFAYGAISITTVSDRYAYQIFTANNKLTNVAYVAITIDAVDYYMPDYQLLNKMFVVKADSQYPYITVLAQPKKSTNSTDLFFTASASTAYEEQKVPIGNLSFSTMSAPFWDNRSDANSPVGFLLVKRDFDSSMGSQSIKGTLCTLLISNMGATNYSDIRKSITIKDMGVTVAADGAMPLSVQPTSGQRQMYAYWVEGQPGELLGSQNDYTNTYVVKACLIDMQNKLTSPPFNWITLEEKVEKLYLMPVTDLTKPVVGYYLSPGLNSEGKIVTYGVRKLSFQLQTGLRILTFSTDNSAVAQGKDFGMFFRLENIGSLVVKGARINVKAKKISGEGADEVLIKNVHIDMSDPQLSSIVHYDGLESTGRTTQGAYTVYRIYDVNDAFNGNFVITRVYGPDSSDAQAQTERLKGMMPGNIATFKTNVTNSPTTWKGQYALYAEVVGIDYTLALGSLEDAAVGTVTRIDNPSGADTFTVTNPGSETAASGLFGYDPSTPATPSAQTNQSNNTALNDTLTTGDSRYADIGYNNLSIDADTVWINGEEYASVTLGNIGNPASPKVTPILVARVLNADGTYSTTYRRQLITSFFDGFTRSMLIPLSSLLGDSAYYEDLQLSIESATKADTYELSANKYDTLLLPTEFSYVLQPEDQTVMSGETATFSAAVIGATGPFTYRWQVRYPDGSFYDVPGGVQSVLTLPNTQISQSGLVYWVMTTDRSGRSLMSDTATLTVTLPPSPATGDTFNLPLWIAILVGSGVALWLLLRHIPFNKRRK